MKLLILTQKVDQNDDVLGFMHGWIEEFAKNVPKVTVICLEKRQHSLPGNVEVLSLGKESGRSKIKYLYNFYRYIFSKRKEYDAVFVHMNHEYVILGGIFWRLMGKKVALWYAHGHVGFSLRAALFLSNIVFTSGKSGFRIDSPKVRVVGQGIDTEKFKPGGIREGGVFKIISVGRINPSKDYVTLIKAAGLLKLDQKNFTIGILGVAGGRQDDIEYEKKLKALIAESGLEREIVFYGAVPNRELPKHLAEADLFVNMGQTGSIDKAVLEAMSAGVPVLTCNEAFSPILAGYEKLLYPKQGEKALADKIRNMMEMAPEGRTKLAQNLREIIIRDHRIQTLIQKIIEILTTGDVRHPPSTI
jgi:glycosyltransferase involved in cell wall biosynthesis